MHGVDGYGNKTAHNVLSEMPSWQIRWHGEYTHPYGENTQLYNEYIRLPGKTLFVLFLRAQT